jgi:endonuclease YncB( thermonuclease family)
VSRVLPRRRIFRPAREPRRWRRLALACAGLLLLVGLTGIGTPSYLFGSAPRDQGWFAAAGEVRVVDGDTLRLGDRTLRLSGVEAPPRGERCADATGRGHDCGAAAAEALARLVAGHDLVCRVEGRDRFGRGFGQCAAGQVDVNAALVAGGFALAQRGQSALEAAEGAARQGGRGLWAPGATAPEAWSRR